MIYHQRAPLLEQIKIPDSVNGVLMYKIDYYTCGQLNTKAGDITIIE